MGVDLKKITAKQVLGLAKSLAGMTNEEIAEKMGQDHASVKRYFNEGDQEYFPSLLRIPRLCKALGNSILLDWIQVQLDDDSGLRAITSDSELLRRVNRLAGELGGVHQTVDDTLSGPGLDSFDPRRLLAELFQVENQVKELRRSLQQASGERLDSEGWETMVARGE